MRPGECQQKVFSCGIGLIFVVMVLLGALAVTQVAASAQVGGPGGTVTQGAAGHPGGPGVTVQPHDNNDNSTDVDDPTWAAFKARFKKNYTNPADEGRRRANLARNKGLIDKHNADAAAGKFNFTLSENDFSDWTPEEYDEMLGSRPPPYINITRRSRRSVDVIPYMPVYNYSTVDVKTLPATVNWTAQGRVGPIQNQGKCGSCWSYSAVGALEGLHFNVTGQFVKLSEQNLIDCSWAQGNTGCDGGNVERAFWYVQQNGIESLAAYPDTSNETGLSNYTCKYNQSLRVMNVSSWRKVNLEDELALQQAVALVGPVSVFIDASSDLFQNYGSGVYSDSNCSSDIAQLNHAVLVVGYGVYNNTPYWLIKNSYGTSWGMNGYMMMARNSDNMCGIASYASFPVATETAATANATATTTMTTNTTTIMNFSLSGAMPTSHSSIFVINFLIFVCCLSSFLIKSIPC